MFSSEVTFCFNFMEIVQKEISLHDVMHQAEKQIVSANIITSKENTASHIWIVTVTMKRRFFLDNTLLNTTKEPSTKLFKK